MVLLLTCWFPLGVKNPISLAKVILDTSSQPLSLHRVPPNILVGQGAKEFAEEHGIATTRNEFLVSRGAMDRYLRWSEDLRKAEAGMNSRSAFSRKRLATGWRTPTPADYGTAADPSSDIQRQDHTSAITTGTWNEGQPASPSPSASSLCDRGPFEATAVPVAPRSGPSEASRAPSNRKKTPDRSPFRRMGPAFQARVSPSAPVQQTDSKAPNDRSSPAPAPSPSASAHDGPGNENDSGEDVADDFDYYETYGFDATRDNGPAGTVGTDAASARHAPGTEDADMVTDTVGAIAIDLQGNIAAGSSSGGIGMKHKGRIGPAALVGVGTAVVPEDPDDDLATSVAAVTSGTGEHMATCLASARCAERLFQGTRRGPGGRDIPEEDEHTLLESFITDDFMNHPGVRSQTSPGAIGVMAVKKDRTGFYFYFAHNTDSFALASMSSTEREPLCVMSRLGRAKQVAQGGRKVRLD